MQAATTLARYVPVDQPVYGLTVEKYDVMIKTGVIGEDDPVELVEGVLVFKMPANEPHETTVGNLQDVLPTGFHAGWFLRTEQSLGLVDSTPQPDGAVVRGRRNDYAGRRPDASRVVLVIEVSDSSLAYDRNAKRRMYARASIATYWIVNLAARTIEIYTNPLPTADPPTYADRRDVTADQTIALPAAVGGATIRVADLLPPA